MEELMTKLEHRTARRKIVVTGVKLAYAAPIIAATSQLTRGSVLADEHKAWICHSTCSTSNPYVLLHVALNSDHFEDNGDPHTVHCKDGESWPDLPALTNDAGEACCPDTVGGTTCPNGGGGGVTG